MEYEVSENILLLEFLYKNIQGKSKNNIKTLLKNGIYVNNIKTTRYDYKLKKGDVVKINSIQRIDEYNKLEIIYEDNELLVVNKPCNLLTVATNKEKEKTLYHYALEYLKRKKEKVFIVHRLDRETSGIVVFAKNEKIKNLFQDNWNELAIKREYITIVNGNINPDKMVLKDYLNENKNHLVYVTDKYHGKEAVTEYEKLKSNDKYSLLNILIKTGRKNQIRVQLSNYGYSILGDKKYGKSNEKRLYLHALLLKIKHPITGKIYEFKSNIPNEFKRIIK